MRAKAVELVEILGEADVGRVFAAAGIGEGVAEREVEEIGHVCSGTALRLLQVDRLPHPGKGGGGIHEGGVSVEGKIKRAIKGRGGGGGEGGKRRERRERGREEREWERGGGRRGKRGGRGEAM